MEKLHHANTNSKKADVALLIPDKINFKSKNNTRIKEEHFIAIEKSIH